MLAFLRGGLGGDVENKSDEVDHVMEDDKPGVSFMVDAATLLPPRSITLNADELDRLNHGEPDCQLSAATRVMRARIGRRDVAYPMPVGKWSVYKSKEWRPEQDDVIVLTFHKTGTTWCQQICHQLRCGANEPSTTSFHEITEVIPWIDFAWEIDQDLRAPQVAKPRLFKSHARLSAVHEGCKYLATIRDPVRTLVSLYKFFVQKNAAVPFLPPEWLVSVDEFAKSPVWLVDSVWGGNIWEYFVEFWQCRDLPNIQLLAFEDMKSDLPREIRRVFYFMKIDVAGEEGAALVERVAELSSLQWMKAHDEKFSEGWFYEEQLRLGRFDRPPLPPVAKVNAGPTAAGSRIEPNADTLRLMEERWAHYVTPRLGFASYEDMLTALHEERQQSAAAVAEAVAEAERCFDGTVQSLGWWPKSFPREVCTEWAEEQAVRWTPPSLADGRGFDSETDKRALVELFEKTGRRPDINAPMFGAHGWSGHATNAPGVDKFGRMDLPLTAWMWQHNRPVDFGLKRGIRGVVEVDEDGRVTMLDLSDNNLCGELPDCIGRLTELRVLYLSHNKLRGPWPRSLKGLTKLEKLKMGFQEPVSPPLPAGWDDVCTSTDGTESQTGRSSEFEDRLKTQYFLKEL